MDTFEELLNEMIGSNVPNKMEIPGPGSQQPDIRYMTVAGLLDEPKRNQEKPNKDGLIDTSETFKKMHRILHHLEKKNLKGDQLASLNRILDDLRKLSHSSQKK